jgi:hypothetical protein
MGLAGSSIRKRLSGPPASLDQETRSANRLLLSRAPDFLLQIPFQRKAAREGPPAHPVPDLKDGCLFRRQGLRGSGKAFLAFM